MEKPTINIIAALGEKTRVIGRNGKLPWHIPVDLKRFKTLTMGHPIIMGRKTYESIGKVLPGRTNIVITRNEMFSGPGIVVAHSVEEAINKAAEQDGQEIFIIGGAEIYRQTMAIADRLYLTFVQDNSTGDIFFPVWNGFAPSTKPETGEYQGLKFAWQTFERKKGL